MWAHIPILEFDYDAYFSESETSISSIINRVLLFLKVQSITTFRLYGDALKCSDYDLLTWITTVIERNVQYLEIDVIPEFSFRLPQCFFTCKKLVTLSLSYCVFPRLSGAVFLPSLTYIFLFDVEYVVEENLPRFLSGCPVLGDIVINKMRNPDMGCLNISSPTIKWVSVENLYSGSEFVGNPNYRVKIDAPALRDFQISDCSLEQISFSRIVPCLRRAHVDLNSSTLEVDNAHRVLKFLGSFCNVECLFLVYEKNLDLALAGSIVKFNNLRKLELAADWRLLSYFLRNADNLQDLTVKKVQSDLQCWMEPHQVPKCLLSHLRIVKIDLLGSTEHEFELIRYLFRNAKVLERMEIYYRNPENDWKPKFDALKRISSFKRGSEECELVFH